MQTLLVAYPVSDLIFALRVPISSGVKILTYVTFATRVVMRPSLGQVEIYET